MIKSLTDPRARSHRACWKHTLTQQQTLCGNQQQVPDSYSSVSLTLCLTLLRHMSLFDKTAERFCCRCISCSRRGIIFQTYGKLGYGPSGKELALMEPFLKERGLHAMAFLETSWRASFCSATGSFSLY